MKYYPINLDIRDKKIIVIGGGSVAHQKVIGLLEGGAQITLISPHLSAEIVELQKEKRISVIQRSYQKGDLEGAFLVFGATNHPEINQQIHKEARERGILFNAVDQPEECDFTIPSRISRGELLITISTGGKAPFLAKAIRKKLESIFGPEYGELVNLAGKWRKSFIRTKKKNFPA